MTTAKENLASFGTLLSLFNTYLVDNRFYLFNFIWLENKQKTNSFIQIHKSDLTMAKDKY